MTSKLEKLVAEVSDRVFRAKCPHGCEHAGEGVLFKFQSNRSPNKMKVTEIGLDYRDNLIADCTVRLGSSENWLLLKVKNEPNPYTYAVHRIGREEYELFITSEDKTVERFPLQEVDPRYEDVSYYERRPSRKRERSRSYDRHGDYY